MNVIALVSWWDEHPDDITLMVDSLHGLVDRAVFLDGRYAAFPDSRVQSPVEQYAAALAACSYHGIGCTIEQPAAAYAGNEVEKRARLFELAAAGTTREDWFLRVDPDERVDHGMAVRAMLQAADRDVAEVTATGISASREDRRQGILRTWRHRAFFRAVPGLTVKGTHWRYTDGSRDLWGPGQHMVRALDLTGHVTVSHVPRTDLARSERAEDYYEHRDTKGLEG